MSLQPITSVYSTGINDFRDPLQTGSLDFHYVISPPAMPIGQIVFAKVADTSTTGWVSPWDNARWVSINVNPGTPSQTAVYRTVFNLDRFDASTAILQGEWVASGSGKIYLNGLALPLVNSGQKSAFTITGPFTSQFNELAFEVRNDSNNNNGLLVSMTGAAVPLLVPEPSGFIAMATGLIAAAIGLRWRRKQN